MSQPTPLHAAHVRLGGRMVDFGGWHLPISYGSQIDEHQAVRADCGMFDVSHMTVVDLDGAATRDFLRRLVANDVGRIAAPGRALYTCMLNEAGGVIDDLIVYHLGDGRFRLVVNAATRTKDLAWIGARAQPFGVAVRERPELAMIAVQGPQARARVGALLPAADAAAVAALPRFAAAECGPLFVARTGYTGEDGFEVVLPAAQAEGFWQRLLDAGVRPCGLGARDTLRLEAGMNLYGQDMDESTSPLESGLAWTVAFDDGRDFVGRVALEAQQRAGVPRQLIGLVLDDKGVLRHGQVVATAAGAGEITSGSFAPTLGRSVAMARVPAGDTGDIQVEVRGRALPVRRVDPPFVRNGKPRPGV